MTKEQHFINLITNYRIILNSTGKLNDIDILDSKGNMLISYHSHMPLAWISYEVWQSFKFLYKMKSIEIKNFINKMLIKYFKIYCYVPVPFSPMIAA